MPRKSWNRASEERIRRIDGLPLGRTVKAFGSSLSTMQPATPKKADSACDRSSIALDLGACMRLSTEANHARELVKSRSLCSLCRQLTAQIAQSRRNFAPSAQTIRAMSILVNCHDAGRPTATWQSPVAEAGAHRSGIRALLCACRDGSDEQNGRGRACQAGTVGPSFGSAGAPRCDGEAGVGAAQPPGGQPGWDCLRGAQRAFLGSSVTTGVCGRRARPRR
jgi:hypothetical protein